MNGGMKLSLAAVELLIRSDYKTVRVHIRVALRLHSFTLGICHLLIDSMPVPRIQRDSFPDEAWNNNCILAQL